MFASYFDVKEEIMPRTISGKLSGILEELELNGITYITLPMLDELIKKNNIKTLASTVASRLHEKGWLLPTQQRGVWEYVPAAVAGTISNNDTLSPIKTFNIANPNCNSCLTLQSAAWALGLADRTPSIVEAVVEIQPNVKINDNLRLHTYKTNLPVKKTKGVNCLSAEGIIVHIASDPKVIKSWNSAMEWIPDVVYEINIDNLMKELEGRSNAIKARTGYMLQGMFPDASEKIYKSIKVISKNRFGKRNQPSLRNDEKWKIIDTALPISPKEMEKVK